MRWNVVTAVVLAAAAAVVGGQEHHHVVGGDRGWEVSNDIASWSAARIFSVGDTIWFTYSAAEESIAELGSREEFMSCDLSNPITMYTNGIDKIPLDTEGVRRTALISSSVTGPVEGVEAVFADDDDDAPLVALFFAADGTSSFTDFAS
nr:mavicyanin-like [Ipomoea batatas]